MTAPKTLVLSGSLGEITQVLTLLEQVDTPPRQVMVEVKVIDVSPSFLQQLGAQYAFAPIAVGNVLPGTNVNPATGGSTTPITIPFNNATFSRLGPGFGAQISALTTKTNSKMLADPRVQVTDNDDASIFIGDTVRTQISQSGISGTTIQVLEFPVGIILLVRPRVNADGHITMRVHPVVSTITSLSAGNIPQTSNREAETTVMVQDGETIIIGGLIRDDLQRTVSEIPILSKLPLVGELFRYRQHNRVRSEVMVFITPHLTNTMTEAERANSQAKVIEETRTLIPNPKDSKLPADVDVYKGKKTMKIKPEERPTVIGLAIATSVMFIIGVVRLAPQFTGGDKTASTQNAAYSASGTETVTPGLPAPSAQAGTTAGTPLAVRLPGSKTDMYSDTVVEPTTTRDPFTPTTPDVVPLDAPRSGPAFTSVPPAPTSVTVLPYKPTFLFPNGKSPSNTVVPGIDQKPEASQVILAGVIAGPQAVAVIHIGDRSYPLVSGEKMPFNMSLGRITEEGAYVKQGKQMWFIQVGKSLSAAMPMKPGMKGLAEPDGMAPSAPSKFARRVATAQNGQPENTVEDTSSAAAQDTNGVAGLSRP